MKQEWTEADSERVRAEQEAHMTRRAELVREHGQPKSLTSADALALASACGEHIDASVTADQVYASLYRDAAQADAWLGSNLEYYGHPTLARATLPDGQVIGIIDLRPAMARQAEHQ